MLMPSSQEEISERPQLHKAVLGSITDEDSFCSSEIKHDRKNGVKTKVVCFGGEITGNNATTPKQCPGFQSWWRFFLY
jgi:hypothetical protein